MSEPRSITPPEGGGSREFWDDKRERIYRWFRDRGAPSFAETYKGAVINLHSRCPGYVRSVCHCVRDIINGLPAQITGFTRRKVEYVELVGDLGSKWDGQKLPRVPPITDSAEPGPTIKGNFSDTIVPGSVVASIVKLLDEHDSGRERSADNPYQFFEVCAPENKRHRDLIAPMVERWKEMRFFFQRHAHESGNRDLLKYADELQRQFQLFEDILLSFATGFYEQMQRLDEILDQANA